MTFDRSSLVKAATGIGLGGLLLLGVGVTSADARPPLHAPARGYRARNHHNHDCDRVHGRYSRSRQGSYRYNGSRARPWGSSYRYGYGNRGPYGDLDGDGRPNYRDKDKDGDGRRNERDRAPKDPRRW